MQPTLRFRWSMTASIVALHLVALYVLYDVCTRPYALAAWLWNIGFAVVALVGISVGYHRYFTHQAFVCKPWTARLFAYAGALAFEGPLWKWVRDHIQHHAFTDREGDPHTPRLEGGLKGFLWAHVGWLFFETVEAPNAWRPTTRIDRDPIIAWQKRWYWPLALTGFLVPFVFAGWDGVWLAFLRVVLVLNITWSVNSVCHIIGSPARDRAKNILDTRGARNVLIVAVLGSGEGYHANHHAQANSAFLGWRWFDWDTGKWLLIVLEWLGVVSNINRPRDI